MYFNFQSQILIGSVLGGSSLVKPPKGVNYYLSMRSNNDKWLMYKISEMPDFFTNCNISCYKGTLRCNSCCHKKITGL